MRLHGRQLRTLPDQSVVCGFLSLSFSHNFPLYSFDNMRINKQTIRKGKEDKASVIFLTAKKKTRCLLNVIRAQLSDAIMHTQAVICCLYR